MPNRIKKVKSCDHNKMDGIDMIYGWTCVAEYLINSGGDICSYVNHMKFASQMLHSRQLYDLGAIKYDRYIIDKFIGSPTSNFDPDSVGSA